MNERTAERSYSTSQEFFHGTSVDACKIQETIVEKFLDGDRDLSQSERNERSEKGKKRNIL